MKARGSIGGMAPINPATAVYEVSDQLLAEYGLRRGVVALSAYSCADSDAVLISLAELRVPAHRGLAPDRLRRILLAVSTRKPLPAVPLFREPNCAIVLDGMHRYAVAAAVGYSSLPCLSLPLEEARDIYLYPEGQR